MQYKKMTPAQVKYIVVHCSATQASADIGAKEIDRWHRERGMFSIGYHLVIRRDGTPEKGRELDQPGAHARGFNERSIGVCLVGGIKIVDGKQLPENNFTDEQFKTLQEALTYLKQRFPGAEILGHRDLPNVKKDCPCFDVRTWTKKVGLD